MAREAGGVVTDFVHGVDIYRELAERFLGRPLLDSEWTPESRREWKEALYARMYDADFRIVPTTPELKDR